MIATTRTTARRTVLGAAALSAALLAGGPAAAIEGNPTDAGALRLLVAEPDAGTVQGGIGLDLKPGWKTYWRNPGDAGIAPVIDSSQSVNVASVDVDFPAPHRFGEQGMWSAGYSGPVVLPFRVRVADPARPAKLVLKVLVGVCREICIPLEQELKVDLGGGINPRSVVELARARTLVPEPLPAGDPLAVVRTDRDGDAVVLSVRPQADKAPVDLFVDGPEALEVGMTERIDDRDGLMRWRVPVRAGATKGPVSLRATVVSNGRSGEQRVTLAAP